MLFCHILFLAFEGASEYSGYHNRPLFFEATCHGRKFLC